MSISTTSGRSSTVRATACSPWRPRRRPRYRARCSGSSGSRCGRAPDRRRPRRAVHLSTATGLEGRSAAKRGSKRGWSGPGTRRAWASFVVCAAPQDAEGRPHVGEGAPRRLLDLSDRLDALGSPAATRIWAASVSTTIRRARSRFRFGARGRAECSPLRLRSHSLLPPLPERRARPWSSAVVCLCASEPCRRPRRVVPTAAGRAARRAGADRSRAVAVAPTPDRIERRSRCGDSYRLRPSRAEGRASRCR